MQEWFACIELLGIAGFPATEFRIREMAKREGWQSRPREGRGGGMEYHFSSLPKVAQLDLAARLANVSHSTQVQKDGWLNLSAKTILKAQVIQCYLQFRTGLGYTTEREAVRQFLSAYEMGHFGYVGIGDDGIKLRLSESGFRTDWLPRYRAYGPAGLEPRLGKKGARTYTYAIKPAQEEFIVGMIAGHPNVRASQILDALSARFKAEVPSLRSIQRFVKKWRSDHPALAVHLKNPDEYRARYRLSLGDASESIKALNQVWELDATPGDIMLKEGRYTVIGCIDVYSRRLKLLVSKSSKSAAVAQLMRKCMIEWGVPLTAKTDNGKEFTSGYIRTAINALGIHHKLCTPFQPQEKPFIERAFRTFSHGMLELMDGFIGHNVAERKAIDNRRSFANRLMKKGETLEMKNISAREFQAFCDKWTDLVYLHKEHSSLRKSPFQKIAEWRGSISKITDERALDILLCPIPNSSNGSPGIRKISKTGLRIEGQTYWDDALISKMGRSVFIRMDESDVSKVYVFESATGPFLCTAFDLNADPISRQEKVQRAKTLAAQEMSKKVAEVKKAAKEAGLENITDEIFASYQQKADKLKMLPKEELPYDTGALVEARKVLSSPKRSVRAIEMRLMTGTDDTPISGQKPKLRRWAVDED